MAKKKPEQPSEAEQRQALEREWRILFAKLQRGGPDTYFINLFRSKSLKQMQIAINGLKREYEYHKERGTLPGQKER